LTELYQIWKGHTAVIGAPMSILDVQYIALFQKHSASKASVVENSGQILDYLTAL